MSPVPHLYRFLLLQGRGCSLPRMTGLGTVWHTVHGHPSRVRDVMILQPVVGPGVTLPRPPLRDVPKRHLTLRSTTGLRPPCGEHSHRAPQDTFQIMPLCACPLYEMCLAELKREAFCLSDSLWLGVSTSHFPFNGSSRSLKKLPACSLHLELAKVF